MNTNGNKSLAELEQRAAAGNAQAQFELAARYLFEPNLDVHIGRVVHKKDPLDFPNSKQTSSRSDFDVCFQKSLKQLETSANQGLAEAQFTLGLLYFQGPSTKEITRKLQTAWSVHVVISKFPLSGEIAVSLSNFSKFQLSDNNAAFSWFEKAAKQNYYEALIWLGICHRDGIGTQANNEKAFACFASAAKQGLAEAQWLVADCYFKGQGVEQNETLAYDWLEKAADGGYPDDRYYALACDYLDGNPETRNLEQGIKWLKKASPFNIFAKMRLAEYYLNGVGVEKNDEIALDLLLEIVNEDEKVEYVSDFILGVARKWSQKRIVLDQSDKLQEIFGRAAYIAAQMFYEGIGTEANRKFAVELLGRAIECENSQALQLMEETYLKLITPELDGKYNIDDYYRFSYKWLSDAFIEDPADVEINFALAVLYAFGKGVEKSVDQAESFFKRFDKKKCQLNGPEFIFYEDHSILQNLADFYTPHEHEYSPYNYDIGKIAPAFFEKKYRNQSEDKPYLILPALRIAFYIEKDDIESLRKFLDELDGVETVFHDLGSFQQFKLMALMLGKQADELNEKNKALVASKKELEETLAMFAHKFRSPLDAIIYNTEHEHQEKLYKQAAQTMRGLLDIFSMIATDSETLVPKIQQDSCGSGRLTTVLERTLDMILLHLLSTPAAAKIQQHYLRYAKDHDLCDAELSDRVWKEEYFELERQLQIEWEHSYAQLLADSAILEQRLNWIEQRFFKLEVRGFERSDIQFREYGDTESLLTIVLNEVLVNAFKYYASPTRQPVVLEWLERDHYQILRCQNPSQRNERNKLKGSRKGHVFLSSLARKTASEFSKPKVQDEFVVEFGFASELLISS